MINVRHAFALMLLAALLAACASLGLPTAQTFNEKLAVGYGSVTTIRQTATNLLTAKQITADDADNVLKSTDAARTGLDVAKTLSKTDMNAAGARLNAVTVALTALQTYLATRSK